MGHDSPGVRVPPPLYYIGGFGVGIGLHRLYPIGFEPSTASHALSLLLAAAALALAGSAAAIMLALRTGIIPHHPATVLVRRGPFRFTRNPMYLSLIALYVSLALWWGLVWPLITLPLAVAALQTVVIRSEEAYLSRRFGEDYREYMRQVPRWLFWGRKGEPG